MTKRIQVVASKTVKKAWWPALGKVVRKHTTISTTAEASYEEG